MQKHDRGSRRRALDDPGDWTSLLGVVFLAGTGGLIGWWIGVWISARHSGGPPSEWQEAAQFIGMAAGALHTVAILDAHRFAARVDLSMAVRVFALSYASWAPVALGCLVGFTIVRPGGPTILNVTILLLAAVCAVVGGLCFRPWTQAEIHAMDAGYRAEQRAGRRAETKQATDGGGRQRPGSSSDPSAS